MPNESPRSNNSNANLFRSGVPMPRIQREKLFHTRAVRISFPLRIGVKRDTHDRADHVFERDRSYNTIRNGFAAIRMMSLGKQRSDAEKFTFCQGRDEHSVIKLIRPGELHYTFDQQIDAIRRLILFEDPSLSS